jgi:glutamate 5-kinase
MSKMPNKVMLSPFRRIAVKVGSSLLVDPASGLKKEWLASLAADIAALCGQGKNVMVVSSGAIALGRTILGLGRRPLKLEESQAAASAGQIALASAWSTALGSLGLHSGQVLLTLGDTEERRRYLNARATMDTLLKFGAVPVVNENDTIATNEIRYGDNDRLAARVATMMGADLLVLLSDVDGLYDSPPAVNPDARLVPVVEEITPEIENMAGAAASVLSRGGMKTKLEAAKIATTSGTAMIISSGQRNHPLAAIERDSIGTLFKPSLAPVSGYKSWIAGNLEPAGRISVDPGAEKALRDGRSLLAVGITKVTGNFSRGDTVAVENAAGRQIARGLVAYDAPDVLKIAGLKTGEIAAALGYEARAAVIHRDDMALVGNTGNRQHENVEQG